MCDKVALEVVIPSGFTTGVAGDAATVACLGIPAGGVGGRLALSTGASCGSTGGRSGSKNNGSFGSITPTTGC